MRRIVRPMYYLGIIGLVFGLAKLHSVREDYAFTGTSRFMWTVAYAVLHIVTAYGAGLPDLPRTRRQSASAAFGASAFAALGISVVQLVTGDALLPRLVVFGGALLAIPWSFVCVTAARGGIDRARARDRVFLVAEAAEAQALREELSARPERPAVLMAHVLPSDVRPRGPRSKPLIEEVLRVGANLIVLDRAAIVDADVVAQAASMHEHGVRIRTLSLFYEQWLGKLPISELERVSLLFDIREVHAEQYGRLKRLFDMSFAVVGLVPLAVVTVVVAIGNSVGNQGPLLYRQPRVGKNGRVFSMIKFRTMRPDVEAPTTWTQRRDPRVTPFGAVLRRTHLDELPQVVNILRGDLSVVGPRPEQPRYVEELVAKLPFYDLRHVVRPGLTGWAQVKYGYAGDDKDALEKLQYEFWYLRNQRLALDARILGRTIRSVLGEGAGR